MLGVIKGDAGSLDYCSDADTYADYKRMRGAPMKNQ